MWDSSGTGGPVTAACTPAWAAPGGWGGPAYPPTTKFTAADLARVASRTTIPQLSEAEYLALKNTAKTSGIYCNITTGGNQCWKNGTVYTGSITDISGLANQFVAYYDYAPELNGNLSWNNTVGPCPTKSAIVVARNAGVTLRGGGYMYGSIIAPEGAVDSAGNYVVKGTVIANSLRLRGTAGFSLDACAVANQPSTTMNMSVGRWMEVDRE